ncbi:SBBP repeat-containing protein [Catalinimonas niigatensis]|uniref:SBBP repeat-containing protein n=1 Tax=Catalinimonas niigatensis TaxID=1397264 RepID=UPI0026651121|nr:SBBP repeat-containing protein [Catalinimonas niigatensis]WPP52397.1 T9SS type A sorting domain-containing protein [Catalinimonas niigatensis]
MRRKLLFIFIIYVLFSLNSRAQVPLLDFAISFGGIGYDGGSSIVTDASGNIYVSGYFQGTIDVDPGEGIYTLTAQGGGETGTYILKLDAQKNLLWAKSIESSSSSLNEALALDATGNLYLTGVDPSLSMYVQKMDTEGNLIWKHIIETTFPQSIATDGLGNVYVTGEFLNIVDFDPSEGTFFITAEDNVDNGFVLKLDGTGNFLWAKSSYNTRPNSIHADASGNVSITGTLYMTATFNPEVENLSLTAKRDAIFVQKLDTHGNLLWVKMVEGEYNWDPHITTDISGNVLVTGKFLNTVDFDPGEDTFIIAASGDWNCFILKLDKDGNFLWAKANETQDEDNTCGGRGATDASGNVYIVGGFDGTVDFDPSEGTRYITALGYDMFVQKLDIQGNLLWVKNFGGNGGSGSRSVTIDTSGNMYITGNFWGTMDFDPSENTYELVANGDRYESDAFILKLSQCTPTAPVPDLAQLEDLKAECVMERPAAPTASNNCGESFTATTDAVFPITIPGTTLITWTFTDPHGHTTTQQQKVILENVTAPVPDLAQLDDLHGQCTLDAATAPTATDNCGKVYTGTANVSFPITSPGITLITWTFEDEQENISSQTQQVILEDTIAPVPDLEQLPDLINQCSAAMPSAPTATDNCDLTITATTDVVFPVTTPGTTEVQWTFEDSNGNTTTQTQNIIIEEPLVPVICMVTVNEQTSRNMLSWSYDAESVVSFGIYRETNIAHQYALVEYVEGEVFNTYLDKQSLPAQRANRYKITAVDSCGFESDLSHPHKTMHLTINKGVDDAWNLIWDGYEGLSFGTYRIYRGIDNSPLELLTEIASNLTSFTDTETPAGSIAYQIEVVNPNSCGADTNQRRTEFSSSKSNIARSSVITSIGEAVESMPLLLYPNPVEDILQIDKKKNKALRIEIWDNSGKLLASFTSKQQVTSIDMSGYISGIYFVKLNDKFTHKVIKN